MLERLKVDDPQFKEKSDFLKEVEAVHIKMRDDYIGHMARKKFTKDRMIARTAAFDIGFQSCASLWFNVQFPDDLEGSIPEDQTEVPVPASEPVLEIPT